jgi:hypothetical protein
MSRLVRGRNHTQYSHNINFNIILSVSHQTYVWVSIFQLRPYSVFSCLQCRYDIWKLVPLSVCTTHRIPNHAERHHSPYSIQSSTTPTVCSAANRRRQGSFTSCGLWIIRRTASGVTHPRPSTTQVVGTGCVGASSKFHFRGRRFVTVTRNRLLKALNNLIFEDDSFLGYSAV